jgi:hypothetical protein
VFSINSFADIKEKVLEAEKPPYLLTCAILCNVCPKSDIQYPESFNRVKAHLQSRYVDPISLNPINLSIWDRHGIAPDQVTTEHWRWRETSSMLSRTPGSIWLKLEEEDDTRFFYYFSSMIAMTLMYLGSRL